MIYSIWLSILLSFNTDNILKAIKLYGSEKEIYLKRKTIFAGKNFIEDDISLDDAKNILELSKRNSISILKYTDSRYPNQLININDFPYIIYVLGDLCFNEKSIAVIGARECTPYGIRCTKFFVNHLTNRDYVIVSGLAKGIDSISHKEAVKKDKKTIAVLGSGLLNIYPKDNIELSKTIIKKGGCIVSEYPPLFKARRWTFPKRNRIISGLSRGVLIVEGKQKSGSLITASHALDQGREVFGIPNTIFSKASLGVHELINDGAFLVTSPYDIISYYDK